MSKYEAAVLSSGQDVQVIVPHSGVMDIAYFLAPYLIVLDNNGRTIASSATLDGRTPSPDGGVFASVRALVED